MSTSPNWSRRLASLMLLELLALGIPGCGSLLAFTPERAAVEALLTPSEIFYRPESIVPDSIKVAQTQDWQDGKMVAITFSAFESDQGGIDCLYINQVTRPKSRWVPRLEGGGCWPVGGTVDLFEHSLSQSWGSDEPGMSIVYGLVYDERIAALDILWEDGERDSVAVVNVTYLWPREGVHETVLVRPLDSSGDPIK